MYNNNIRKVVLLAVAVSILGCIYVYVVVYVYVYMYMYMSRSLDVYVYMYMYMWFWPSLPCVRTCLCFMSLLFLCFVVFKHVYCILLVLFLI